MNRFVYQKQKSPLTKMLPSIFVFLAIALLFFQGISLLQQQYPLGKYPDSGELTILINSLYSTASSEDAPADKSAEEIIHIFFDDTFSQCRESSAFYIMNIHLTCKEQMIHAVLQIYENTNVAEKGEPVYLMEAKHHIARRTEK